MSFLLPSPNACCLAVLLGGDVEYCLTLCLCVIQMYKKNKGSAVVGRKCWIVRDGDSSIHSVVCGGSCTQPPLPHQPVTSPTAQRVLSFCAAVRQSGCLEGHASVIGCFASGLLLLHTDLRAGCFSCTLTRPRASSLDTLALRCIPRLSTTLGTG